MLSTNSSLLLLLVVLHQTVGKQFTEGSVSDTHNSKPSIRNNDPYTTVISQNNSENTSSVEIKDISIAGINQTSKKESFQTDEEYTHFIKVVNNHFSLDPQRALLSLIFLMGFVMVTVKVCKMKVTSQFMEWPHDYQNDVHYMEIYDIIRMKKEYLPKAILNWNRKVRRKLQKERNVRTETCIAVSSNESDKERLIQPRVYDF
ncbi:hypothetical protein DPMN_033969 [Dreissena polymorpha]|uniref:Uncharacterized protein n=1 Tax=Dreissena polymorpha TaxID=45954 RepID=A0A9D4RJM6_DREPO|nr:hypothetical protein DPMN_033969 [Dreissena polymorpha]